MSPMCVKTIFSDKKKCRRVCGNAMENEFFPRAHESYFLLIFNLFSSSHFRTIFSSPASTRMSWELFRCHHQKDSSINKHRRSWTATATRDERKLRLAKRSLPCRFEGEKWRKLIGSSCRSVFVSGIHWCRISNFRSLLEAFFCFNIVSKESAKFVNFISKENWENKRKSSSYSSGTKLRKENQFQMKNLLGFISPQINQKRWNR